MGTMLQDLRFAIRALLLNRAYTLTSLLLLTLGIGVTIAIFGFVSAILVRPLPLPDPDQVMIISETHLEKGLLRYPVSPRNLEDWERESKTIAHFGAWRDWGFRIATPDGPMGVSGAIASPGFFDVLGLQPVLGRPLLPEDNRPVQNQVILLSHRFWQSQFGGDADVIGRSLLLNNRSFTVVGVLPADLEGLNIGRFDVWAPLSIDPDQNLGRHHRNRQVYTRLRSGVSLQEAQAEMTAIAAQLAEAYPADDGGWGVTLRPLHEGEVGSVRTALLMFFGAVGFVLLIACANIANLQLARAARRQKEFAIRTALGATRFQLVRQLLVENVVLALLGGAGGLLLAYWAIDLFAAFSPGGVPRLQQVRIDGRVLGFTLLLTLTASLLFGLVPAVQASRINLVEGLKEGQKTASSGARRLRSGLVVAQIALALILLMGAGLLSQSFVRLLTLDAGFNPDNLITVQLFPPSSSYTSKDQVAAFYQRVTEEFRSIPGVEAVGATSAGPQFGGEERIEVIPDGVALPAGESPQVRYYDVSPDYFQTMQIPILRGREFTAGDDRTAPPVALINETLARRYWPGENPVGKHIRLARGNKSMEVVGVVGDIRRYDLEAKVEPELYWPYRQEPRWAIYFVLRTGASSSGIASALRNRVTAIDNTVFVSSVRPMTTLISSAVRASRFNLFVLGVFASLALLLAAVGLYAVVSYAVVQRTREIGIRMALGARRNDILRLIIGQGLGLALLGLAVGLAASLLLTRYISSLLFEVSPTDSATVVTVSLLLLSVAVMASYIPAKRATGIDPMAALRYE